LEVDAWYERQLELMKRWPTSQIVADTGIQRCRLAPVFPTPPDKCYWWPLENGVKELDEAIRQVEAKGLLYDRGRKTTAGFCRALAVRIS
jgi:hypothetical protein